jgi:hypothetical protein
MIERFDIIQNTEDWFQVKLGKFSASSSDSLLMDKKTAGYSGLIKRIIEERITGMPSESKAFQGNVFTERGHELESAARNDYSIRNLVSIREIGVIELDSWVLCSPDGLIDDNGLYQAKCPIFSTQVEYLKTRKVPTNYLKQMQFELYVSGREYNVFNSYHPMLPPIDIVVYRDEVMITEIRNRLDEAKEEVLKEIEFINSLK